MTLPQVMCRRSVLVRLGGMLIGAGLMSACGGRIPSGNQTSPPPTSNASTRLAAPPAIGARTSLVIGQLAQLQTTAPYPASPASFMYRSGVFNALVTLNDQRQPIPELAESWVLSEDHLTLTFKIRQNVKFHSGRPFTAEEARWNIEYAQDPKTAAQSGSELKGVQARAIDASTLELKLPDLLPHVFSLLADVLMADPQSDLAQKAAGTGPFQVDTLTPGDELRLLGNDQYWRSRNSSVQGLTLRSMGDAPSAVVALDAGSLDLVQVPPSEVARIRAGSQTSVAVFRGPGSYEMVFNTADAHLSDKRVRQAISLGLDRARFASNVMYGLTDPTYVIWPHGSPVWDASQDQGEFNLNRARDLLKETGSAAFEVKLQTSSAYPETALFAQIVQADLAQIGINVSIEQLAAADATTLYTSAQFPGMLALVYSYADQDPALLFTTPAFRTAKNASRFGSPDYTQLVDAARRETDPEKRSALYHQINAFVQDQAFVVPVANSVFAFGMRSNVSGVVKQALQPWPALEHLSVA